jgi:flavin-dependent dehydrogenase
VSIRTDKESYQAKAVVGADGSKGISRRLVKGYTSKTRVARLLEVLAPADERTPHFSGRYALFEFSPVREDLQGYFWEFPSWVGGNPTLNCGVYDSRLVNRRDRANLLHLLEAGLNNRNGSKADVQVQGHPIHWFSPRSRFAVPRLLLVGDAAGVDSLFGEGIAPALAYGKVAAETIQNASSLSDYSFRDYRQRLMSSIVGRYLLVRWCIAWWSYHLSWSPLFMHMLWTAGNLATKI